MARISVKTLAKAHDAALPLLRGGSVRAYFDGERDPLHLHLIELAGGEAASFAAGAIDRVLFVWRGSIAVAGERLEAGSSIVIEKGRALGIAGGAEGAQVLCFAAARAGAKAGGHVHLLPVASVPRAAPSGPHGVSGGMHADSACPTCEVWLHENHFPGGPPPSAEEQARGVHSHTEDEIIFVTAGQIRLGNRLHEAGTALGIAAGTLYGFTAGPEGMSFVNFRPSMPGDIRFAQGGAISETGYWRERVPRPAYLAVD